MQTGCAASAAGRLVAADARHATPAAAPAAHLAAPLPCRAQAAAVRSLLLQQRLALLAALLGSWGL